MANIKSQIKRNRQNEKRQLRNKAIRSELKTRSKNALLAADSGDADQAAEALRLAQQRIDTAVAKGVLHKNTARRKSASPAKSTPPSRRQAAGHLRAFGVLEGWSTHAAPTGRGRLAAPSSPLSGAAVHGLSCRRRRRLTSDTTCSRPR